MLIYLEKKLGDELPNIPSKDRPYFQHMYGAACSANRFMRAIYHSAFWLSNEEQVEIISQGRKCMSDFMQCAECAFKQNLTRWKLQTKFHSLGEIIYELETRQAAGHPNVNPLVWCNQQDEDFVGRVSGYSRHVSIRTIHERTISRFQIALASKW